MSDHVDVHVHGHCYCGAITFEVSIPAGARPIFAAYCHCDSCRRAHAAPLYHVVCVEASMFRLTSGQDQLREFRKSGSSPVRAFCETCGSKLLNRFPGWTPGGRESLAFFPALLDQATQHALPEALRPRKHNRPEEAVLDDGMLRGFFDHD